MTRWTLAALSAGLLCALIAPHADAEVIRLANGRLLQGKIVTTFHGYDVNRKQYTARYYRRLFRGGDFYTAYTVIAVPALVYAVGAYGFFALPYTIIVYPFVFMVMPLSQPRRSSPGSRRGTW